MSFDNQAKILSLDVSNNEYRNSVKLQKYQLRQSHLNEEKRRLVRIDAKIDFLMKTKLFPVSDKTSESKDESFHLEKCNFATDQQNRKKRNLNENQLDEDNLKENSGSTNDYFEFEDQNLKEFEVDYDPLDKNSATDKLQQKLFKTAPLETFIFF